MHHHPKFSLSSSDSPLIRGRSTFSGRSQSPATSSGNQKLSGHSSSPAHASNGLLVITGNGHTAFPGSTNGNIDVWTASSNVESSTTISNNGFEQSQCCYHCNNQKRHCSTAAVVNPVMINGANIQTIEEQIRAVDKVIKDCDNSRKNLENLSRRLDDLNDEVKRYRDFLGHEKARRDPTFYKTMNSEPPSPYNDHICGIMSNLTFQLTKEWGDKLGNISTSLIPQTPSSTSSSKMSERN